MTDDKSPGAIRSGLLVISHLSLVICHFESWGPGDLGASRSDREVVQDTFATILPLP